MDLAWTLHPAWTRAVRPGVHRPVLEEFACLLERGLRFGQERQLADMRHCRG